MVMSEVNAILRWPCPFPDFLEGASRSSDPRMKVDLTVHQHISNLMALRGNWDDGTPADSMRRLRDGVFDLAGLAAIYISEHPGRGSKMVRDGTEDQLKKEQKHNQFRQEDERQTLNFLIVVQMRREKEGGRICTLFSRSIGSAPLPLHWGTPGPPMGV